MAIRMRRNLLMGIKAYRRTGRRLKRTVHAATLLGEKQKRGREGSIEGLRQHEVLHVALPIKPSRNSARCGMTRIGGGAEGGGGEGVVSPSYAAWGRRYRQSSSGGQY